MKFLFLSIAFYLLATIQCSQGLLGAYSVPSTSLLENENFINIHNYMVEQHPELIEAEIVSISTQLVAGTNYKIHYKTNQGKEYEAVVLDQPWRHTRTVTSYNEIGSQTE